MIINQERSWVDSIDPKSGALSGRHEAVTTETRLLCPSPIGARGWHHAAYNPNTNSGTPTPGRLAPK